MLSKRFSLFHIVFISSLLMSTVCATTVNVYPALPGNIYKSDRYEVNIIANGISQSSYVYKDTISSIKDTYSSGFMSFNNHFTTFSFSGDIVVEIKLPLRTSISSVVVRPLSKKINATFSGNTISIPLSSAANLYLEIDGEKRNPLFVFANPLETNVPLASNPNVIYYGPGIYDIGYSGGAMQNIPVGKTIYLEGGAFVKGVFKTKGTAGTTTFRGRGILSGISIVGNTGYAGMIDAYRGTLNVEGIIIATAPAGFQGIIGYDKNCVINNVKMLSWASNSDCGVVGPNSTVTNCFIKINDDALKPIYSGILYKDNAVWQQMTGSVIMLGWNSVEQGISPTVSGLDVIGIDRGWRTTSDGTVQAFMNLKNSNGATYKNILIENVRIEVKSYMLFGLDIKQTDPGFVNNPAFNLGLGSVDGIVFRNISVNGLPARISYFNGNGNVTSASTGDIKNVTFEDLTIKGTLITAQNASAYISLLGNTSNFQYTTAQNTGVDIPFSTNNGLKLSTNLSNNELTIFSPEHNSNLLIFNTVGQRLMERKLIGDYSRIDISSLSSGIYIAKMDNGNSGIFIKK
ncbi:MAG: T9SS type A sorting domain-containing protein [Paludibacter sp.]